MAHIFYICADILDRRECHGREHFRGADILGARIFWRREYFDVSEYFGVCADISRCAHIFDWKRIF